MTTNQPRAQKLTIKKAMRLANAVMGKLAQRSSELGVESAVAFGLLKLPKGFKRPPAWAMAAARIASASWAKMFRAEDGPGSPEADRVGALVGMTKTWSGVLANPTPEILALEKRLPDVTKFRKQISEISQPHLTLGKLLGESVAKTDLDAAESVEFARGQLAGATSILDESGELKEESSVRTEICFVIWLYWQDLKFFKSISDLEKFFAELSLVNVSRKNLEKICAEIGLRFRGRGRPQNPTLPNKRVGIKKSKTRVKRRDANSRRRKKRRD